MNHNGLRPLNKIKNQLDESEWTFCNTLLYQLSLETTE